MQYNIIVDRSEDKELWEQRRKNAEAEARVTSILSKAIAENQERRSNA